MDPQIARTFNWLLALVLSLSVHEWAHAFIAKRQGDPTAENEGRLTLNPIAHIDILGTLILPLIMMVTSGGLLGWAKPVPVNLGNLRNERWGHMLVAAAGPFSNLILCFVFILITNIYVLSTGRPEDGDLFMAIAHPMIQLNAILAVFNMIPLAPLDGGTVFTAFLPENLRKMYDEYIAPYGMFILIGLLVYSSLSWISVLAFGYVEIVSLLVAKMLSL